MTSSVSVAMSQSRGVPLKTNTSVRTWFFYFCDFFLYSENVNEKGEVREKKGAIISPNFPPNGKIAAKCLEVLRLKKIPFLQVLKGL